MTESIRPACALLLLVLLLIRPAVAQEETPPDAATAGGPVAAAQRQSADTAFDAEAVRAEFREAVDAWGETISETRAVLIRFHNGTAEAESQYRDQFRELQVRGREEFDRAVQLATELLVQDSAESFLQAQFLLVAVHYRYGRDWFELTGPAAEALMAVETKDPKLSEIAGVSFFATGDFDRAEPHLAEAARTGNLDAKRAELLGAVDEYRNLWEREQQLRAEDRQKGDLPRVRFSTTRGDILVELFEDQAPNTVANFIKLVENGYYDQLPFYQVIASQIAMVGDAADNGPGGPGSYIADENQGPDARAIFRGSLAMAKLPDPQAANMRTLPNTARSHFFFALMPLPQANSEYTVFGRVIEGIDTVSALRRIDPTEKDSEKPAPSPDRVLTAEVVRKRSHPYQVVYVDEPSPMAAPGTAPGSED